MKLTEDERKTIIDALRLLEGVKRKLDLILQRSRAHEVAPPPYR